MSSSYENLQKNVKDIDLPEIEVWENQYQDRRYVVDLDIPECTCVCPKTGLPDFMTLIIKYCPDKTCLELKSLKMYIVAFRDVGIFHEHLVNRILDDIVKACNPYWAKVKVIVTPRGGIQTTVRSKYRRDGDMQ